MNKNFKVITINGIRGIFAVVFIILGLIAGFIISPGWVCMQLWNHYAAPAGNFALMNLLHGIILWAIIALTIYALNNKRSVIGFGSYQGLTPEQIKDIMNRTRQSEEKIKRDISLISGEFNNNSPIINKKDNEINKNADDVEEKQETGSSL